MHGDEPRQVADEQRENASLPHVRGDEPTAPIETVLVPKVCPTCVGMNRAPASPMPSRWRLPHVRGDEPDKADDLLGEIGICPTCVGMNRMRTHLTATLKRICPTCVGMNRNEIYAAFGLEASAPHAWG